MPLYGTQNLRTIYKAHYKILSIKVNETISYYEIHFKLMYFIFPLLNMICIFLFLSVFCIWFCLYWPHIEVTIFHRQCTDRPKTDIHLGFQSCSSQLNDNMMMRMMMTNKISYHQNILSIIAEISGLFKNRSKGPEFKVPYCDIQRQYSSSMSHF